MSASLPKADVFFAQIDGSYVPEGDMNPFGCARDNSATLNPGAPVIV